MAKSDMKSGLNPILTKFNKLAEERGLNRYQLALKCDIDPGVVNRWYSRNSIPDFANIAKVVEQGFEISLSSFFAEDDEPWFLEDNEKVLIRNYRRLSREQGEKLIAFIDTFK